MFKAFVSLLFHWKLKYLFVLNIFKIATILNLQERPPPVPPSRAYTISGNSKLGYPQSRVMKMTFPEESQSDAQQLKKGEVVTVMGASTGRGHLLVEHKGQSFHVPFQYMELITSESPVGANLPPIPTGQPNGVKI